MKQLALSALVIAGMSSPLLAQYPAHLLTSQRGYGTQCMPGLLHACASVDLSTFYDPTAHGGLGGTEIRVRIANPQGLPGFAGGPIGLKEIAFENLQATTGAGFPFRNFELGVEGTATSGNILDTYNLNYSGLIARVGLRYDYDSYLFGCTVPTGGLYPNSSTCGGAIIITIEVVGDDLRLVNGTSVALGFSDGPEFSAFGPDLRCSTGTDCVVVTPEPVTIALLGTGLAGVGLLRRRRRRDGDE